MLLLAILSVLVSIGLWGVVSRRADYAYHVSVYFMLLTLVSIGLGAPLACVFTTLGALGWAFVCTNVGGIDD